MFFLYIVKENNIKTRNFVFTNWNLETNYADMLEKHGIRYIACGRETCPWTGKLHDQGWITFRHQRSDSKKALNIIGNMFGEKHANIQAMRGSLKQNNEYCGKENELRKFGDEPKQGSRADLVDVCNRIKKGEDSAETIALEDPDFYHQFGRTMEKIEDISRRHTFRNWMTKGEWVWGPTGAGKSHRAFQDYDTATHYVKPIQDEWWDGYKGQPIVILNEFRGNIPFAELLSLVDKWPHFVKRRCREPTPFLARKLIITSSLKPEECYSNVLLGNDSMEQFNRRFAVINLAHKWSEGNNSPSEPPESERPEKKRKLATEAGQEGS